MEIVQIVLYASVLLALMIASAWIAKPIIKKGVFAATTPLDRCSQCAPMPIMCLVFTFILGITHQLLLGPGCRDLSQPITVEAGSKAAALGLQSGDYLIQVNSNEAANNTVFSSALTFLRPGSNEPKRISIAAEQLPLLFDLFESGVHAPIRRHPVALSELDWRLKSYSAILFNSFKYWRNGEVGTRPVSFLFPEESMFDQVMLLSMVSCFATYLFPLYYVLRAIMGATIAYVKLARTRTMPESEKA